MTELQFDHVKEDTFEAIGFDRTVWENFMKNDDERGKYRNDTLTPAAYVFQNRGISVIIALLMQLELVCLAGSNIL
jgi:hypothetical protein